MDNLTLAQEIVVWILPILFAVTLHEVAHGWVASLLGDKTALYLGRLTLNPFKHIDLFGTMIVPIACLFFGGFIFGWAKPVPVDWRNLKHPKRDTALVAVAGPMSNFVMALIWGGLAKLGELAILSGFSSAIALVYMGKAGIQINLLLMVLNLLPLPPLDGSRVVSSILPRRAAYFYDKIEAYGFIILVVLMATNMLSQMLLPPFIWLEKVVLSIFW